MAAFSVPVPALPSCPGVLPHLTEARFSVPVIFPHKDGTHPAPDAPGLLQQNHLCIHQPLPYRSAHFFIGNGKVQLVRNLPRRVAQVGQMADSASPCRLLGKVRQSILKKAPRIHPFSLAPLPSPLFLRTTLSILLYFDKYVNA